MLYISTNGIDESAYLSACYGLFMFSVCYVIDNDILFKKKVTNNI